MGLRELMAFDMDKIQNPFVVFDLSVPEGTREQSKTSPCSIPSGEPLPLAFTFVSC